MHTSPASVAMIVPLRRALLCFAGVLFASWATAQVSARASVWVGTTDGVIRVFALDASGKLRLRTRVSGPRRLRFLAFHPRLPVVYGSVGKRVQMYRVGNDEITPAGSQDAGVGGTHVEVDPSGRFVFLASYGGGAVVAFPLDEHGEPGPRCFELRAPQQLCRKAHQVRAHPDIPFVYAPCLGDDALQIMRVGKDGVEWRGRVRLATGSGPRHMDFHPDGKHLYVLNESASSIYVYRIEPSTGALTEVQSLSALPQGRAEGSRSSDIHVSHDGRFVYAVHREPLDEIVALRVGDDGRLVVAGRTPTGGTHSRCFALTADGRFVVLAHSKTQNIIVRRIDPKTGVVGAVVDEHKVAAAAIFVGVAKTWK